MELTWQDICDYPKLQDLPFKIELNEKGQVVMSPVKVYHSAFQGKIAKLLPDFGNTLAECAIRTRKGTKVADVAWASEERFSMIANEAECSVAPEICIEVLSSANTAAEMREKRKLYFEVGAKEVWFCDRDGKMKFFNQNRELKNSQIAAEFPKVVRISNTDLLG